MILFVNPKQLKDELNRQFREKHPELPPSLTLSKIRSLKVERHACASFSIPSGSERSTSKARLHLDVADTSTPFGPVSCRGGRRGRRRGGLAGAGPGRGTSSDGPSGGAPYREKGGGEGRGGRGRGEGVDMWICGYGACASLMVIGVRLCKLCLINTD